MNFVHLLRLAQLHGIYRLSEKKDRFIWLIALLALFGTAVTSALVTLWRYESKPTYITRRENYRYNMTFPAVLICPELDFPDHKMEQFLENIRLPSNLNRTYIKSVLRQLATYYSPDVRYTVKDLENLAHLLRYNGMSLKPTFLRLTSTCEEMLLRCRWHGIIWNCTKLFQMEIMQFGTCCVFNGRSLKRDIVVQGLPLKRPSLKQYVNSIGYKSGMTLAVNQGVRQNLRNVDLSYKWIIFTSAQRYVESLTENGTALSPGLEMWFGYKIDPFEVSENSKSLSIGLRRCYLPNDEHLKYFPVYKQHYCRTECEIANMLKKCKCSMPTHPLPSETYCEPRAVACAKTVMRQTNIENCKCLPTCDSNAHKVISTSYELNQNYIPFDSFYKDLNFEEVTIIRLFVQEREVTKSTRQSYFTAYDLFGQMGGIFGVFFGSSVLSILEISQLILFYIHKRISKQQRCLQTKNKLIKKK